MDNYQLRASRLLSCHHVITGGTGMLGTALILELAERFPDDHFTLIARPRPGGPAATRKAVIEILDQAARHHQRPHYTGVALAPRLTVIEADLTDPTLRSRIRVTRAADTVWHLATDHSAPASHTTMAVHTLNAAQTWSPSRVVITTPLHAIPADHPEDDRRDTPANARHEPFWRTEQAACNGYRFPVVVLRLATLIGDTQTGAYTGTPAWLRPPLLNLAQPDAPATPYTSAPAYTLDPEAPVSLLHVDQAARHAVTCAMTAPAIVNHPAYYHLTPAEPLTVANLAARAAKAAKLPAPAYVAPGDPVPGTTTPPRPDLDPLLNALAPTLGAWPRARAFAATGSRHATTAFSVERALTWHTRPLAARSF